MGDGHLNKCKECKKHDSTKHRSENLEKIRNYDKQRASLPHRRALHVAYVKAWKSQDKRRSAAHRAVAKAIRQGDLVKSACVRCSSVKSVAHHEDYDKPLEVMWLCDLCHKQRHRELKEDF
jgi:hypothetical protein